MWSRERQREKERNGHCLEKGDAVETQTMLYFWCIFVAESPRKYNLFMSLDVYYTVATGLALYLHYLEWDLLIGNPNCTTHWCLLREKRGMQMRRARVRREGEKEWARQVAISMHVLVLCYIGTDIIAFGLTSTANWKVGMNLPFKRWETTVQIEHG